MVNGCARADHFTIMGWNRIISGGRRRSGIGKGSILSQIEVGNPGNGGKGVCILIISNGTPWYTPEADNEGCTKVSMFVVMVLDGFSLSKASVN